MRLSSVLSRLRNRHVKTTSDRSADKRHAIRTNEIMTFDQHHCSFIFGMSWQTVLGSQSMLQAKRLALLAKATHYVYEPSSEAVGYVAIVRRQRLVKSYRLLSAAQCFANLYAQGLVCAVLPLSASKFWFVAARDGCVLINADMIFNTRVEVEQYKQQLQLIESNLVELELPSFVAQAATTQTTLVRLQNRHYHVSPKLLSVFVLIGVSSLVYYAWKRYQNHLHQQVLAQQQASRVTPEEQWRKTLQSLASKHTYFTSAGFYGWGALFFRIPTHISGWNLDTVICQTKGLEWECEAKFIRHSAQANNKEFEASKPVDWRLTWVPMNEVKANFLLKNLLYEKPKNNLPTLADQDFTVMSALQKHQQLFQRTHLTEPKSLVLTGDYVDSTSPDVPRVEHRRITLEGPVRSLFLINSDLIEQVSWKKILLTHQYRGSVLSLSQSALMMKLEGDLYARRY